MQPGDYVQFAPECPVEAFADLRGTLEIVVPIEGHAFAALMTDAGQWLTLIPLVWLEKVSQNVSI